MFHAKRRNNRGVQTFRCVVWEKEWHFPVLKSWLRSTTTGSEAEVFVLIGRVQKNLQVHGEGDSIVNARSLYEQYIKHKLARKSISKLIIVEGMYINGN